MSLQILSPHPTDQQLVQQTDGDVRVHYISLFIQMITSRAATHPEPTFDTQAVKQNISDCFRKEGQGYVRVSRSRVSLLKSENVGEIQDRLKFCSSTVEQGYFDQICNEIF